MVSGYRPLIMIVLLLFVAAFRVNAQTPEELSRKYGPPADGHYTLGNGIVLTVTFSNDKRPCEMIIEHRRPLTAGEVAAKFVPPNLVGAVMDEIVPEKQRGRRINDMTFSSGINSIRNAEFERVRINQVISGEFVSGRSTIINRAVIYWKAGGCKPSDY